MNKLASPPPGGCEVPPSHAATVPVGMARGAVVSSVAVMGSRIMGLLREQAFAFFFGASREYDAFLTAFRIPNLLRDLLAEGALSTAFVTTFVKDLQLGGRPRAYRAANAVINALLTLLVAVVLLGWLWAPQLVVAMAHGFDTDKAALATVLTRIMFPFILFVALAAVAMGMLNAQEHYAVPQSASSFFNLISLAMGLGAAWCLAPHYMRALWTHRGDVSGHDEAPAAMVGMAIGTLCGGLAQWRVQVPTLRRLGYRFEFGLDLKEPSLHAVMRLMGPAVVGAAAVQINVFVNSNFASVLGDRAISWLNYAFRLMQFPIGIFGVAVMTAALPAMSRSVAAKDHALFGQTLTGAIELVLCLTLPATVGLALLSEPIMCVIYEHGRFTPADTHACARALSAYALGLPGYSALKVLQPAHVALNDAKTPMMVALCAILLNVGLNYAFVHVWGAGHVGLALSTSLLATANAVALCVLLELRRPSLRRWHLAAQVTRLVAASALVAVLAAGGHAAATTLGRERGSLAALLELAVLIPICVAAYLMAGHAMGVEAVGTLVRLGRQRLRRRA